MVLTKMTESQASAVYDILCASAKAPDGSSRDRFIREFTGDRPANEWRFCGSLGFGGKFRFPRMTVDCYPEDATAERRAAIEATNAALADLCAGWCKAGALG